MAELACDPFGRFTGSQPQGRRGVAHLVGAPLGQSQVSQQRVPDPVREVLVIQWCAHQVAEHVVGQFSRHLVLLGEGLDYRLTHLDVALAAIGFGVFILSKNHGFSDPNQAALEIYVAPFEAMDFAGAHTGEKAHGEIVAIVRTDGRQNALYILQAERIHIDLAHTQSFDVGRGRRKLESVGGFVNDLAKRANDLVDPFG